MIGDFGKYGEIFNISGRYSVKERQDLLNLVPKDIRFQSILELGCADGSNLSFFSNKLDVQQKNCVGVDICAGIRENSYQINFVHSSIEDFLSSCIDQFDLILLSDVLEHLYNPWKVLSDVRSSLSRSGYLLISVPNFQNLNYLNAINSGNFIYQPTGLFDETHIRFFSATVLKRYLVDAGFCVVSEGWRPDSGLLPMKNEIQQAIAAHGFANLKIGNLTLEISDQNIEEYFAQQVLLGATYA